MLEPPGLGSWGAGWRTLGDSLSRRLWSLQSEELCAEAKRRTGLEDFGEPSIEPALSILVNSLELQADLHPLGRFLMRVHLLDLLETRLRLVQAWSKRSEALTASLIQRPIFITDMPRSGSTFLHELLRAGWWRRRGGTGRCDLGNAVENRDCSNDCRHNYWCHN